MPKHRKHSSPQKEESFSGKMAMRNPAVNWEERLGFPKRLLNTFEHLSLAVEKLISHWVPEPKFNPLFHTGTITLFLLFLILVTGVYLTMFYQFGFNASYEAVSNIEANFIGRIVRALHRYASGAAVIFALLHGWRTIFQDRFRGPRWLAWVSGVMMAVFFWLIGISGYWMVWDQRSQVLNQTLINLLEGVQPGTNFLVQNLVTENAGTGWIFILLVTTVHLGLSTLVGLFYWFHIKRLNRAKWLPPRYWTAIIASLLVGAAVLIPVGMLAPINTGQLPASISTDSFFLFYLPAALSWKSTTLWGGILLLTVLTSAIPWILTRKKRAPILVDADHCTGCTLCANDCPYNAIKMIERRDGTKHKFLAEIDSRMCVACGICVGTCTPLAITFSGKSAAHLWDATLSRMSDKRADPIKLVFVCERHAYQGAKFHLEGNNISREDGGPLVQVVPLTCIGMAHPNLAVQALEAGASEVHFVGCPPEDCANREGNLWLQERLERVRLPRLNQKYKEAPIYSDWLSPRDFTQALEKPNQQHLVTSYHLDLSEIKWHNLIPVLLLLGLVFSAQIWLSDRAYQPYPDGMALLEVALAHKAGYPLKGVKNNLEPELNIIHPTRLIIEIDDEIQLDQSYPPQRLDSTSIAFEQIPLKPGEHHILVSMFDRSNHIEGQIIFDELVSIKNHGILKLSFLDTQIHSDPMAGRDLFFDSSLGASASCHICHALEPEVDKVGPSLAHIGTRAAQRVPGMNAETYLRESITNPDAYIVEGYPAGLMLPNLDDTLSEEQIDNLIAFLLAMK